MANPIILGPLTFRSKAAAKQFLRTICDSYEDGERVNEEHSRCLREMLALHSNSEMKAGAGVSHFSITTESKFSRIRRFYIHRIDGSGTSISFNRTIAERNPRRNRFEALWRAIEDEIMEFRWTAFCDITLLECPLRRIPITEDAYHIDHEPPATFLNLVERWLQSEGIRLEEIEITSPSDSEDVFELASAAQLASWQEFHSQHATLRLLSPIANLSEVKTGKKKSSDG